jgi:hypothetical protein
MCRATSARILLTWVLRTTIGTRAVSRDRLDQLLQRPLIARLLALVQGRCHLARANAPVAKRVIGIGSGRLNVRNLIRGIHVGFGAGLVVPEL